MFEECGNVINPTIGIPVDETVTFLQSDRSNYYHPLGFAYLPDGAHESVDELEPTVTPPGTTSPCADTATCPAPMYFLNNEYLGTYSQSSPLASTDQENFGLDEYEPLFFHPMPDWVGYGNFSVKLLFPETTSYEKDIFYFCHIHNHMSGRIKLLKNGNPIRPEVDEPALEDNYYKPSTSDHDKKCGTYNLKPIAEYGNHCPSSFVCDLEADDDPKVKDFVSCLDSMNCAMFHGMTTPKTDDIKSLFMVQMIPHHQNAVNMAKALLVQGVLDCPDLSVESDDCAVEILLRTIINDQNAQIQMMQGYLDTHVTSSQLSSPLLDNCVGEKWPMQQEASKNTSGAISFVAAGQVIFVSTMVLLLSFAN
eukprot:scaffold6485_cov172-Amphora_coffeaeformis.AAC.5